MYRKERISHLGDFLIEPFFHKSDEWIYEKERRLLLPLLDADETWVSRKYFEQNIGSEIYLSKMSTQPIENNYNFLSVIDIRSAGALFHDADASKEFFFMFRFDPISISSIYMGCRLDSVAKSEIKNIVTSTMSHCSLFESYLDRETYSLKFKELKTI